MAKDDTAQLKAALLAKAPAPGPVPTKDLLSTGSTLLNLAMSGRPQGGFAKGKYFHFVGDSSSGKTFFCLTCLAEASMRRAFENYRFIYDNVEDGALMDFEKFFGPGVAARVENLPTANIDEFYWQLDDCLKDERPCIYILDSMDGLLGNKENKKFNERKAAGRKSQAALDKVKGDYGDGKAKVNSAGIRGRLARIRDTGSILIVISQTRDVIEEYSFEDKTYAGGHAIKFYACCQLWSSRGKKIHKTYKEQDVQIGLNVRIGVRKNRLSGKEWDVEVPIYHSFGIDDIGSCVDYLVKWKHWPKTDKGVITATGLELAGTREALIKKIEQSGFERDMRNIVAEVWADVEEACAIERKPRYGQGV